MKATSSALLLALTCGSLTALAQTPPDYGFTWRTIGDPGNVAAQPADYIFMQVYGLPPVGRVDYSYRLTQTEVTNTQWLNFVEAYTQVNPGVDITDWAFTGRNNFYDQNSHRWRTDQGAENAATMMSWFYAARFVNWLQNDKAMTPAAFESGVYDLSTFHEAPPGSGDFVGNTTRSPNARFWIPNWDEMVKGLHWDPNKSGPGQGGYWMYPDSSDSPPVGGLPGTPGAQTSAGDYPNAPFYVPAGSYPNAQSPWGLLDGSGGVAEYMEGWSGLAANLGTGTFGSEPYPHDRLDWPGDGGYAFQADAGLRIASVVPTPGVIIAFVLAASVSLTKRRRYER